MKENNNYKKYISEDEEIRDGFLVTSNRKKVWNIQLGLLEELKKICEKHNITYYADGGTLLGAIRHKGYIPRDDDIDIVMFREDYEKFFKIAEKELPNYMKLYRHFFGMIKLVDMNTTALGDDNRWEEDFLGGINIDIFPIDYASKFKLINWIKSKILNTLRIIIISKKSYGCLNKIRNYEFIINISKYIFKNINSFKLLNFFDEINKRVFLKGKNVYSVGFTYRFFPKNIYDKSHEVKFESTSINIPDGYDTFLGIAYGDYMKPVIREGGHSCRYSTEKSYIDIIKTFDKSKTNEINYSNCNNLFTL